MEPLTNVFLFVFCLSMAFAQELNEDRGDSSKRYVFDLPDIVASYETVGEEVLLEAFAARQVNLYVYIFFLISCRELLPVTKMKFQAIVIGIRQKFIIASI
jgi:hypothetical protein